MPLLMRNRYWVLPVSVMTRFGYGSQVAIELVDGEHVDLAGAFLLGSGLDPAGVEPTTTDNFPRPAPRPSYSVLGHDKWTAVGLAPIRDWHQALQEALPGIQASMSVAESGAE